MKVDFERASILFGIIKDVASVGPMYTALASEASAELRDMNDKIAAEQTRRAKKPVDDVSGQPTRHTPRPTPPIEEGATDDPAEAESIHRRV